MTVASGDSCNGMDDCHCLSVTDGLQYTYKYGDDIIKPYSYKIENYWFNVWSLCMLAVGYRLLAYAILAYKFRKANR